MTEQSPAKNSWKQQRLLLYLGIVLVLSQPHYPSIIFWIPSLLYSFILTAWSLLIFVFVMPPVHLQFTPTCSRSRKSHLNGPNLFIPNGIWRIKLGRRLLTFIKLNSSLCWVLATCTFLERAVWNWALKGVEFPREDAWKVCGIAGESGWTEVFENWSVWQDHGMAEGSILFPNLTHDPKGAGGMGALSGKIALTGKQILQKTTEGQHRIKLF